MSLLTDEQVATFLCQGYLILKTELSSDFHSKICVNTGQVLKNGNPGNNIPTFVPELYQVFDDKVISGALKSLLGNNYIMMPHRYTHHNTPGTQAQQWHKDSFFGFLKPCRHHQPRYIMAMYYPQDVVLKMGPTGLKPFTQYTSIDPKRYKGDLENKHRSTDKKHDIVLTCPAGTVLLIHYDIVHRGTANTSNLNRLMFKFQFNRMEEPREPSWDCKSREWNIPKKMDHIVEPISRHVWNWLCGNKVIFGKPEKVEMEKWVKGLEDPDEEIRYYSAYNVALSGGFEFLYNRLLQGDYQYRICAAYALTACEEHGVPFLIKGIDVDDEITQYFAIFALSEIGSKARESLPTILRVLESTTSNWVKIYSCEALGNLGTRDDDEVIKVLCKMIQVEEWEHVRFTAAMALARLIPYPKDEVLTVLKEAIWNDSCRYVRENSIICLSRMETKECKTIITEYRDKFSGLDPLTTLERPF